MIFFFFFFFWFTWNGCILVFKKVFHLKKLMRQLKWIMHQHCAYLSMICWKKKYADYIVRKHVMWYERQVYEILYYLSDSNQNLSKRFNWSDVSGGRLPFWILRIPDRNSICIRLQILWGLHIWYQRLRLLRLHWQNDLNLFLLYKSFFFLYREITDQCASCTQSYFIKSLR